MSGLVFDLENNGDTFPATDPSIPFTMMRARDELLRQLFDNLCTTFKPSIVCDVGAFNGDESWRFSALLPKSNIIAFEGSPQNYQQFYIENERFKCLPNFRINHLVVTDYVGEISFNVLNSDNDFVDWRRGANSVMERVDDVTSTQVTVPCVTLDSYFGVPTVEANTFAMWLDVEGALDRVLAGAHEVLKKTLFLRAEVEWKELWRGQKLAPELKATIEGFGFQLLGDSFIENGYDQSDVVFLNRRLLETLNH